MIWWLTVTHQISLSGRWVCVGIHWTVSFGAVAIGVIKVVTGDVSS